MSFVGRDELYISENNENNPEFDEVQGNYYYGNCLAFFINFKNIKAMKKNG